ncbi:MAG: phage tail sheath subtilisin-like domain-containing protein [Porcipelethomonas sp.]
MAGGTFDKTVGKVRPGTYINFTPESQGAIEASGSGVVVIPLIGHSYGPAKEFIRLSAQSPDSDIDKLGYSVYDDNPSMLLIREAFKNASEVVAYIPTAGTKASASGGGLEAKAKYGGTRGNDLKYSIAENPVSGFDVTVYLDGSVVEQFEGIADAKALNGSRYIEFTGDSVEAAAGVSLSGGTDSVSSNSDITAFLDAVETVDFNTLCFPVEEESLKAACKTKIKYLRENAGKKVKAVIADYKADYEGIINVTNSVVVNGVPLTHAQAAAWVAGADAAASETQSNTFKIYEGAESIVDAKTHEQSVAAIQNGEFFFSYSDEGDVVVEYDINSLATFDENKSQSYRKNRVIRVLDSFAKQLSLAFPPNRYSNSETGWDIMESRGREILQQFYDAGAITDVDLQNDFSVDKSRSQGDSTYFICAVKPVDSAEKLYFTVSTK